jgi:MFS family permease
VTQRSSWAAVAVVCSALFLIGLDFTVLNVAIPALQRGLRPSLAQTQWIVDGYALTLGGCVLAAGTLSDAHGRRRAFVAGLTVCALASAVGATSGTATQVVAARCGMGLGAALFMPATLATITHVFTDTADRRRAISVWAAVAGLGVMTGPVVGGWLVEDYGWRSAFWLNVPVAAAVALAAVLLVPESRNPHPRRVDRLGVLLSSAGLLALVWAIIEAPERGWTSGVVLAAFAAALTLLGCFARRQTRSPEPMVPVGLLRGGPVGPAALSLALMSFAVFGALFLITLYLQQVRGLTPWAAGVRTVPLSLGMAAGAGLAPLPFRRFGARVPAAAGLTLVAAALAVLTRVHTGSGPGLRGGGGLRLRPGRAGGHRGRDERPARGRLRARLRSQRRLPASGFDAGGGRHGFGARHRLHPAAQLRPGPPNRSAARRRRRGTAAPRRRTLQGRLRPRARSGSLDRRRRRTHRRTGRLAPAART